MIRLLLRLQQSKWNDRAIPEERVKAVFQGQEFTFFILSRTLSLKYSLRMTVAGLSPCGGFLSSRVNIRDSFWPVR